MTDHDHHDKDEDRSRVRPPPKPAARDDSALPRLDETGEPLNVINSLYWHATAVNNYVAAKEEYDQNVVAPPPPEDFPADAPVIERISAGIRIVPDPAKYIIDRSVGARVRERHRLD